jgi:hypothetical protein
MTNSTNRQPTHRLYTVKGDDKNPRWIEIGAAWESRDEKGFTLSLDALPTDGRIVMRLITERENGGES